MSAQRSVVVKNMTTTKRAHLYTRETNDSALSCAPHERGEMSDYNTRRNVITRDYTNNGQQHTMDSNERHSGYYEILAITQ